MPKILSLVDLLKKDKTIIPEFCCRDSEQRTAFFQWVTRAIETLIKRQGGFFRSYEAALVRHYERGVLGRAKPTFSDVAHVQNNSYFQERKRQSPIIRDMRLTEILHHFLSLQRVTFPLDHVRHLHFLYQDGDRLGTYVRTSVLDLEPFGVRTRVKLKDFYLPFFSENHVFNEDVMNKAV